MHGVTPSLYLRRRFTVSAADAEMIRRAVLWRDDHIIALNKPPGLPSQGGSGQGDRHVDGLAEALDVAAYAATLDDHQWQYRGELRDGAR